MDHPNGWMTSGAFAAFCGTTKETLRHYKDIGLLSPAYKGGNGYFYYGAEQFYDFCAISIFRQSGTSLENVRRGLQEQDSAKTLSLLLEQQQRLGEERQKLEQMEFVLSGMIRGLKLGNAPDMIPKTAWFKKEHLLAVPAEELEAFIPADAGEDEMLITVLNRCRTLCRQYGLQTDYRLGALHLPGEHTGQAAISHLYTCLKEQADFPYYMEKPAGNYAYLCCRGRWDISGGYHALNRYICEQGLRTTGSLYAYDLAGFILNGVEKNAASMISIRLEDENSKSACVF